MFGFLQQYDSIAYGTSSNRSLRFLASMSRLCNLSREKVRVWHKGDYFGSRATSSSIEESTYQNLILVQCAVFSQRIKLSQNECKS